MLCSAATCETVSAHTLDQRLRLRCIRDTDERTFLCQTYRDRLADAAADARDERHLATVSIAHFCSPAGACFVP